jgi:hypothetical protein
MKHIELNIGLIKELKKNVFDYRKQSLVYCGEWADNMQELIERILVDGEEEFKILLNWSIIQKTMFVGNAPYIDTEYEALLRDESDIKWKKVLHEIDFGNPIPYDKNGNTSGNSVHSAYHIKKFHDYSGARIQDMDAITEFGGGYGCLCRIVRQLGYDKLYCMYDLPILSYIQSFYLKHAGYHHPHNNEFNVIQDNTPLAFFNDFSKLQKAMNELRTMRNKLFIATFSLSETPIDLRESIRLMLEHAGFNHCLIVFQCGFSKINNVKYFKDFEIKGMNIEIKKSDFRIAGNDFYYLIGRPV